jgi:hypothetical protein
VASTARTGEAEQRHWLLTVTLASLNRSISGELWKGRKENAANSTTPPYLDFVFVSEY